jgi:type VI secretion system VasD/TssJ family lipoprotein
MKRLLPIILGVAVIVTAYGCASGPPPAPVFQKEAIRLNLKADARLNLYQASPHTLLVCTYQLVDPNGFNQLVDEPNGMAKIMECGRFDSSVAATKRFVMQPGSEVREMIDRAEGAKYIGLAAGYYTTQKDKPFRLYRLPVKMGKKDVFPIDAYLGALTIQEMGGK